jgi:diacylglycerol kinase (ATP)
VVLGFIPAGGVNDVARALGIPDDPIAAARVFLRSRPRPIDVVQARTGNGNTGVYVGGGGLGLDAQTAQLANGRFRRLSGAARYVTCVLAAVSSFEPFHVQMELDGNPTVAESGPLLLAAVANAPAYGAGVQIAPMAAMNDGLLDIVLVSNVSRLRLIELLPVMLQTGKVGEAEIRRFRARRVVLRADRRVLFHGDGEVIGEAPVEVEALPGAIHVAAPARV